MSYNKYGEYELCQDLTHSKPYYISRDRSGFHVLREEKSGGKEIFSPVTDDGKKNKKRRVMSVDLLYDCMI